MRKTFLGITLCAMIMLAITVVGCGGSFSGVVNPPVVVVPSMVPVSFTVGDDPPAGVAVLRFQVQITSASLQPSDTTQPTVSMLLGPLNVELLHLQTETAPLGNVNVPAGTYNGLTASFANPQMTIFNNTGHTLTVGAQSCLTDQVCIFNPSLNQTVASVQSPTAPFPVTLSSNSPVGFEMHFDVNTSVQGDLSVTPKITLRKVIPPSATTPINQFHVIGRVTAVNSPNFTIQTGFGNLSASIATDSNTTYDFGSTCAAQDFSCLVDGQVVGVAVKLFPGGTLLAAHVRLIEKKDLHSLQGIVVRVNVAQNRFDMVLQDLQETFASVNPGLLVSVQINSSTNFIVDSDGVTIPSGLTFSGIGDLMPGQTVEIHPSASPVVTPGPTALPLINVSADGVALEPTEISGTVGSVNAGGTPPNFMLVALSPLFARASISLIQVDSVTGTVYINATGLAGLNAGDRVSVGGLLFNTPTTPTVVAERVRVH
jgi:hypothetical protein